LAYARVWHLVDAKQRVLGRMSVGIAETLMGKHKPIYDPACTSLHYVVAELIRKQTGTGTGTKALDRESMVQRGAD